MPYRAQKGAEEEFKEMEGFASGREMIFRTAVWTN